MYDRSIKKFDEPHAPVILDSLKLKLNINKGKLINEDYSYSYLTQIKTILELNVKSVLEIGPGDDFNGQYFRDMGIEYESMNLPGTTNSKYKTKLEDFHVNEIPERFDLVAAFQMLEHSPYENFPGNIRKMADLSKRYIFISLPFDCYGFEFSLGFRSGQKSKKYNLKILIPTYRANRKYRKEYMEEFPWAVHYWEIGRRGFPLGKILNDIRSAGLNVVSRFHGKNHYHYFILAEKLS